MPMAWIDDDVTPLLEPCTRWPGAHAGPVPAGLRGPTPPCAASASREVGAVHLQGLANDPIHPAARELGVSRSGRAPHECA